MTERKIKDLEKQIDREFSNLNQIRIEKKKLIIMLLAKEISQDDYSISYDKMDKEENKSILKLAGLKGIHLNNHPL